MLFLRDLRLVGNWKMSHFEASKVEEKKEFARLYLQEKSALVVKIIHLCIHTFRISNRAAVSMREKWCKVVCARVVLR